MLYWKSIREDYYQRCLRSAIYTTIKTADEFRNV